MNEELTEIPQKVVDEARKATCARCQTVCVDEASMLATTLVSYYVPSTDVRRRLFLCGMCSLGFREYLAPELIDDPDFQDSKRRLMQLWAAAG